MHQLDREVGYFKAQNGKNKRKINFLQQVEPGEEATQALKHQGSENVEGVENVEFI